MSFINGSVKNDWTTHVATQIPAPEQKNDAKGPKESVSCYFTTVALI